MPAGFLNRVEASCARAAQPAPARATSSVPNLRQEQSAGFGRLRQPQDHNNRRHGQDQFPKHTHLFYFRMTAVTRPTHTRLPSIELNAHFFRSVPKPGGYIGTRILYQ